MTEKPTELHKRQIVLIHVYAKISVSGDRNSTGALSSPAPSVALSCQVVHPHHCNRHHLPYHVTCQAAHPHHHQPDPPH